MAKKSKKNRSSKSGGCPHCRKLEKIVARLTGGTPTKQRYFDEKWVAHRLGLSVKTLQKWRSEKKGPKVTMFGRSVRYRLRDIIAYERSLTDENPS